MPEKGKADKAFNMNFNPAGIIFEAWHEQDCGDMLDAKLPQLRPAEEVGPEDCKATSVCQLAVSDIFFQNSLVIIKVDLPVG